jgi:hypothetical protein
MVFWGGMVPFGLSLLFRVRQAASPVRENGEFCRDSLLLTIGEIVLAYATLAGGKAVFRYDFARNWPGQ